MGAAVKAPEVSTTPSTGNSALANADVTDAASASAVVAADVSMNASHSPSQPIATNAAAEPADKNKRLFIFTKNFLDWLGLAMTAAQRACWKMG